MSMRKFAKVVESIRAVMSHERSIARTQDGFVFWESGRGASACACG